MEKAGEARSERRILRQRACLLALHGTRLYTRGDRRQLTTWQPKTSNRGLLFRWLSERPSEGHADERNGRHGGAGADDRKTTALTTRCSSLGRCGRPCWCSSDPGARDLARRAFAYSQEAVAALAMSWYVGRRIFVACLRLVWARCRSLVLAVWPPSCGGSAPYIPPISGAGLPRMCCGQAYAIVSVCGDCGGFWPFRHCGRCRSAPRLTS